MEIQGGKFLTFLLGEDIYGIPIKKVKEILGKVEVTGLPITEGNILGTANFRGKGIPIVDLRQKFGMEHLESPGCICVVVDIDDAGNQIFCGLIVDMVSEVSGIAVKDIEPPPEYEAKSEGDFLVGLGKLKNKLILILNCDKILSQAEIGFINQEFRQDSL
jgi:purine-binding chemotaxis protein CheW